MNKGMTMNVNVTEARLILMANPRQGGYKTKTRIYIWPEGETLQENLNNRRSRPLGLYRESAFKALDNLKINRSKLSVKWSQKAGCGCGCSPGFIVDGWDPTLDGKDLHVTITCN
jgi:hypothetical protein